MSETTDQLPDEQSTGFSESWLTLREPADHLARNLSLNDPLVHWFTQQDGRNILELGAGTGSNLRYLMPKLGHDQHWLLLDNDAALFECLPNILQAWALSHNAHFSNSHGQCRVEHDAFSATVVCRVVDLANELHQIPADNIQLLTASALLDLTSAAWLDALAALVNKYDCACLFALNYNGSIHWQPVLDSDTIISALLNEHQLNDKGFGKALGPEAGSYFAQALTQHGRRISTGDSHWVIKAQSPELQLAIIDGWATAALEQDSQAGELISQWHKLRAQAIDQQVSTLTVGHLDVLSLP